MRIGELARRTGVSPEVLRAWERRYGLLQPQRSEGGYRLYSGEDESRVRRTTALIAEGLSAGEAAGAAARSPDPGPVTTRPPVVGELTARLVAGLDAFRSAEAHAAIDGLLAVLPIETFLSAVVIPYLQDLGRRWEVGSASVAQEHFASNLLRGRLFGLAREWGSPGSRTAVLACLPGEAHDLALVMFGLLIARRGWQVTYLGADTPFETLHTSVALVRPSLVVLTTSMRGRFHEYAADVRALACVTPVAVAGHADEAAVVDSGATMLPADIIAAADTLSR